MNQPAFIHQWRAAVLSKDSTLSATQRLALVALAQYADAAGGSCFPSSETVAECSGLSLKSVQRSLLACAALGWIKREIGSKGKNWRSSNRYTLCMPVAEGGKSPPMEHGEDAQSPATSDAKDSASSTTLAEDFVSIAEDGKSHDLALDLEKQKTKQKQKQKRELRSRCSHLPDNCPDDALIEWARQERPDLDIALERAKFRDHWPTLPDKKARKADWSATWRNWIRNAYGRGSKSKRQPAESLTGKNYVGTDPGQIAFLRTAA